MTLIKNILMYKSQILYPFSLIFSSVKQIKIKKCVGHFALHNTQTSCNIPYWVMSCEYSFIFDRPIICKTNQTTVLSKCSVCIISRLVGSSLIDQLKI